MRVLVVVTHLLGAGHLTRAAAISRALAEQGHAVTLASGGRPAPLISIEGLTFVQLPPVQARPGDFRTLRDEAGRAIGPEYMARRRQLLLARLDEAAPDVLLTELFPFGRRALSAEFVTLLDAGQARSPRPLVACSIRDILAPPSTPAKAVETHRLLDRYYDLVLAHSDPDLIRLDASWPLDAGTAHRIAYTGYVDGTPEPDTPVRHRSRGEILVSGGSSAAGLKLYETALEAARLAPDLTWRILVGGGVDARAFDRLAEGKSPNVRVERTRADFRSLLREAGAFVGQAGYNTIMDLFATGTRAVLVPFTEGGETEQLLRAEQLAAKGLASLLPEAELTPVTLVAQLRSVLASPPPPVLAIARDGARRTAEILAERGAEQLSPRLGRAS